MVEITAYNPTLLASLALPNNVDYAGRADQMRSNSVQRQKMLAELAYLPIQQQNETLKNRVYALQQGYTIDPATGAFVPTAAKQAQTNAFQGLLQKLSGGMAAPEASAPVNSDPVGGASLSDMPVNDPSMPQMNPWMQAALGMNPNAPQDGQGGSGVPVIDFGEQSTQAPAPNGLDPQLGIMAAMAMNPAQTPQAINQYFQRGVDEQKIAQGQQKINQNTPEYLGEQESAKKEQALSVESNFDTYKSMKEQYQADVKQSLQLSQIEKLFEKGLKTGKTEEALLPMRKYLVASGLADEDTVKQVGLQEGMTALGNQLALRLRNPESGMGLTGNTSDRDVTFLLDGIETLSKSPAGNKMILDMQKASMEHNAKQFKYVAKLRSDNGGKLPKDMDQKIIEWNDKNPVFSSKKSRELLNKGVELGVVPGEDAPADSNISQDEIDSKEYFK